MSNTMAKIQASAYSEELEEVFAANGDKSFDALCETNCTSRSSADCNPRYIFNQLIKLIQSLRCKKTRGELYVRVQCKRYTVRP